jgi:hypothetical protein
MSEETATESESGSGYSPLLGRMLNLDPKQAGEISLSGLGRRIVGAESAEYKKKLDEVTAAQNAMLAALDARKNRIDPGALALAAGFFAPTRTGSFGENLGMALGNLSKAQEQESANSAAAAKMRYELAKSGLADEETMAKLGMSAIKNLTPKMTKYQQQLLSENVDPNSPAGIERIKQMVALETATADQKAFFAETGVSPTDPAVATKFAQWSRLKPLREVSGELGVDVTTPEGEAAARKQLQTKTFLAQNPELAKELQVIGGNPLVPADVARAQASLQKKAAAAANPKISEYLQSFNGDPTNPADLKKAADLLKRDLETKSATDAQNLANAKLQARQLSQQITENTRNGDVAKIAGAARQAGVPFEPLSFPAGTTPKEAAAMRTKQLEESNKYITENITPYVNTIDQDITDLERAKALNQKLTDVGSLSFQIPGISTLAKAKTGKKAEYEEFDALASKAAAQNKIPNNPSVSNADLRFMQQGVFGSEKERSSNDTIISFMLEQRKRDKDYYRFMSNYAAVNGKLGPTANRAWRDYADANPITVRDSKGAIVLNPNRVTPEQFYSMPTTRYDAQGRPIQ